MLAIDALEPTMLAEVWFLTCLDAREKSRDEDQVERVVEQLPRRRTDRPERGRQLKNEANKHWRDEGTEDSLVQT